MKILKFTVLLLFLLIGDACCGKLKFVAFKGPHFAFAGVKVRTPKLLGLKHHGLGFGHGLGGGHGHKGFGGGGFHSSGYEHHEYHESHHSGGSFGGGGWLGK
ncbi:glycine-rich protein [Calliphora vicina]|uniref:glycine-rich protein n=1 Tax=Calliphora vicina TaxID=7373 RepID=UPI00325BF2DA